MQKVEVTNNARKSFFADWLTQSGIHTDLPDSSTLKSRIIKSTRIAMAGERSHK